MVTLHPDVALSLPRAPQRSIGLRAAFAASLLLLPLTGCGGAASVLPEPREVQCEWHHEDGAVVELESYGTARYRDLPLSIVSPSEHGHSSELVTGGGTWVYGDGLRFNDATGHHVITVRVDQHLWTVRLRGAGDSMTLESLSDDTDGSDAYILEKGACRWPVDYEVNP